MSQNIMINKSHIADTSTNSSFIYPLKSDMTLTADDKIAISKLNIFYAWYNVSAKYNNNKFNILWWDDAGDLTVNYSFVLADGYYTIDKINEALILFMTQNGLFLYSTVSGTNLYLIEIRANSVTYSLEIVYESMSQMYSDGSAAPKIYDGSPETGGYGFATPTGWVPPPSTYEIPQVIISSTNSFGKLIGFSAGATIPLNPPTGATTVGQTYSVASDFTPQMEPSSSFFLTCNLSNNKYGAPSTLMDSFTLTSTALFGMMMSPLSSEKTYSHCQPGTYNQVEINIYDQDFNALQLLDPNVLIIVSIMT